MLAGVGTGEAMSGTDLLRARDHYRKMADAAPDAGEREQWRQLADEIDEYLEPAVEVEEPELF